MTDSNEQPKRKRGQRGPQKEPTKQQVTLRLDREVIDFHKDGGPGWQGRINDTLVEDMRIKQKTGA